MKRALRLPEDQLNEWLDQGTYEDYFYLVLACRKRLAKAIQQADSVGDGPLVNALVARCRQIFLPSLLW